MNDIKGIIEDVEKSSLVSNKVIKKVVEIIGQEEWNNIHDEESDICTTTGELIIALKSIAQLQAQIEKMKRCEICKHYRWNHCSYEINISADCIQNKMKHFELREIKENG